MGWIFVGYNFFTDILVITVKYYDITELVSKGIYLLSNNNICNSLHCFCFILAKKSDSDNH